MDGASMDGASMDGASMMDKRLRVRRLQERMAEQGFDLLVCRLPENVVYISDHWPHHGISVAVLAREGKPLLFIPEVEFEYGKPDWAEVIPFGWALLKDPDQYASYRRLLGQAAARLHSSAERVGVEQQLEVTGAPYRHAEPVVPARPWAQVLEEVFGVDRLIDCTDLMQQAKMIKTPYDLERLRAANELAEMGTGAFLKQLQPGMTEVQVSALIEGTIRAAGAGYMGARLVWAEAEIASGPNTAKANLLIPSTDRVIEEGDLVMVEMATVMDGYYSDLTYMAVAGEPSPRQREVHNSVLAAQQAAARAIRPGVSAGDVDAAARNVLVDAGLGDYFVHVTGHGLGFRFHESTPFLMPGATQLLAEGMVTSVEPGVYIPGFGGIRIEDNVAVGSEGAIFLSTPRLSW